MKSYFLIIAVALTGSDYCTATRESHFVWQQPRRSSWLRHLNGFRRRLLRSNAQVVHPPQAASTLLANDGAKVSTIPVSANKYNPLSMYAQCVTIVFVWIAIGTLFYSICNEWPLPQSFFYAVDAGMSIGFCTDVTETKLISKAFTVIYILLGASVIGGALALFIQDILEGVMKMTADHPTKRRISSSTTPSTEKSFQHLLEQAVFQRADTDHDEILYFPEFQALLQSTVPEKLTTEQIQLLYNKFDRFHDGVIHLEEFIGSYRKIDRFVDEMHQEQRLQSPLQPNKQNYFPLRWILRGKQILQELWHIENRIYVAFTAWILLGITWGMMSQHWDIITATHFAVSALATGGLTAPNVNPDTGILPAEPAIFCGIYCLLGIPLFALTLGQFAKLLILDHVSAMEVEAWNRPMTKAEYDLACHLTTTDDVVHLSDFIVLQLLRQGKLSAEAVQVMMQNFRNLDSDNCGFLTLEQATIRKSVANDDICDISQLTAERKKKPWMKGRPPTPGD
jgi:EF-hand domain pair